ncbi:MAG: hypothetical protein COA57_02125 [Flavobacteriales bacterium]|nr:MAG: hypothetical protein COA57_02125 [Flavobacteriales bacterium]
MGVFKYKFTLPLFVLISAGAYFLLGYHVPRTNFLVLITLFFVLFSSYFIIIKNKTWQNNFSFLVVASVLFRAIFLFAEPLLSDDYFRFFWDGTLLANGINPFSILPYDLIHSQEAVNVGLDKSIYEGLNSKKYYSVYPPIMQFVFALSSKFASGNLLGSIIIMRLVIICAEIGSVLLLVKLLKKLSIPRENVFLYALNPLIIVELSGNLHFEAIMVFFMVLAFYLWMQSKPIASAIMFGLAIATKLIPLLFIPLIIRYLGWKKGMVFCAISCGVCIILFLPFLSAQVIFNLSSSLELYFQKFEFNASIYYLVRWIGYQTTGYNIISIAGKVLFVVTFLIVIVIAWSQKKKNLSELFGKMLLCIAAYYFFSTTVHPWYMALLVMLSVFTFWRFALVWSALIMLSYAAYSAFPYSENLALVAIEYGVVYLWMIYELKKHFQLNPV